MSSGTRSMLRDAAAVVVVAVVIAVAFNALRGDGLPLVAQAPHAVLVPCPAEAAGSAAPIPPDDPLVRAADTVVVDAREADAYAAWHLPGAVHVYYDLLADTPEYKDAIADLLRTHRDAHLVVVYGDDQPGYTTAAGQPGDEAGTGFRLAAALSAQGLRNVRYVIGGADALRAALAPAPAAAPVEAP